jgi:hypothetical protein
MTTDVRWAIAEAADRLGGIDRLVAWARESKRNEFAFWTSIYPRLLPLQVQGSGERGEIEMNVAITDEELDKRLEEHGLPRFVFSGDRPAPLTIEHQAHANGHANGSGDGDDL